jgi:soluble lytic murein transglycosylase-like protein
MRIVALSLLATLGGCVASTATAPPASRPASALRGSAPRARVAGVSALVESAAARHGVPAALVLGVIEVESSFNPRTRSAAGATGLMQLMPRTAASLARHLGREVALEDPEFNIEAGTYYLAYLLRLFGGDLELALAAYNTGPMRVRRWQRGGAALPDYSRRYVAAVLAARDRFLAGAAPPATVAPTSIPMLDHAGLRALLRRQRARYGERADEPLPDAGPASAPTEGS